MSSARAWQRKLADWWARREPVPQSPWMARQVRDNTARIAGLEAQLAAHEAEAAAARADIFDVMARSARAAGADIPDMEQTAPMGMLFVVEERRAG